MGQDTDAAAELFIALDHGAVRSEHGIDLPVRPNERLDYHRPADRRAANLGVVLDEQGTQSPSGRTNRAFFVMLDERGGHWSEAYRKMGLARVRADLMPVTARR